jgi:putative N6-adenine-specific DNA methylase
VSGRRARCFAIAAPGLEPVVAAELAALGAAPEIVNGGVEFDADRRLLFRSNLELRVASRVVVRIASFRARTFFELERHARDIPWGEYVARGGAVTLRVSSSKSKLYHEGAIAQRLMLAIEQKAAGAHAAGGSDVVSARADADVAPADANAAASQMFIVRFLRDECTVSADASGALLHLRGYRQAVAKAPLRETLAASMLVAAGWNGARALIDPMCGSGTIPIEAALIARRIAPGIASADRTPRDYAFERWPGHDDALWADVVNAARGRILERAAVAIVGTDRDEGAIAAAASNAMRAGVDADVAFEVAALTAAPVPSADTWLVTNPPYGVRVGGGDPRNLAAALGRVVRDRMPSGRAVLITPDTAFARHSGLRLETLFQTSNGGISVRALATPLRAGGSSA